MTQPYQPQQPRNRRADRHKTKPEKQEETASSYRAGFPKEDAAPAPLPLDGYDAARPVQNRPVPPRVYEESAYQAPRYDAGQASSKPDDHEYFDDEYLPPRRWPFVLLGVILLLVLSIALSYFLIPKDAGGFLGTVKSLSTSIVDGGLCLVGLKKSDPPRLIKFDTPESNVQTGVKTIFTFTTDKAIDGIRILDEVGSEVKGVAEVVDAPNNTTWTFTAILDKPMTAVLSAGILVDKTWYQTDKTVSLTVAAPSATPELIIPTPAPALTQTLPPQTELPPEGDQSGFVVPDIPLITPTPAQLSDILPVFTPNPEEGFAPAEQADEDSAAWEEMAEGLPMEDFPMEELSAEEPFVEEPPAESQAEGSENYETLPVEELGETGPTETADLPDPTPEPAPTASPMPELVVTAAEKQQPSKFNQTEGAYLGSKKQSGYQRLIPINAQGGDLYTFYPAGVLTFRSDGMRQNAAFGTADMPLDQMSIQWQTDLGSIKTSGDTLYGVGWTGQPAIVKWSLEVRSGMNIDEAKKDVKALKEVIFAGLDGKVYFLDWADGVQTRSPIDIGYPLKSSVSVDAIGRPLIAFGQAVSKMPNKTGDIGYYIYSLTDQSKALFINGRKTKNQVQYATNGAFDGTGLFERNSDSFIVAGENGLLYTVKMNTVYDFNNPGTITVDPEIIYLRGKAKQDNPSVSVESSVAMYGPYAFYGDKQGYIRAVDTTKMETLWMFDAGDNTDATPALDLNEDSSLSLYTGTTVFSRTRKDGNAVLRSLNALTGEENWAVKVKAKFNNEELGGVKASPLVGQNQISNLVIFTVNLTDEGGAIMALNKQTGEQVWKVPLPNGAISSPVAVYRPDGTARVVQADLDGRLYLIDGLSGQVLNTLDLGGRVEGSPAVYNDILVIGTASRDNHKMYGIRLE